MDKSAVLKFPNASANIPSGAHTLWIPNLVNEIYGRYYKLKLDVRTKDTQGVILETIQFEDTKPLINYTESFPGFSIATPTHTLTLANTSAS